MILPKKSLFRNFIIFSFIAFIFAGTILSILVSRHVRNDLIEGIEGLTSVAIETTVQPDMTPSDLSKPFSESMKQEMDGKLKGVMYLGSMLEVNIWSRQERLVYLTGQMGFSGNNADSKLTEVLASGKSAYSVTTVNGAKVIKVYVPIFYNMQTSGLVEVYIPYKIIGKHMAVLNSEVFLVMFSGLLVLYIFLLKTISTASKTLIRQNKSLQVQNEELQNANERLNHSYKNTLTTLSNAVDARDPYTSGHSERVAAISLGIGKRLGLDEAALERLEISAMFHDIGKIGIPDSILLKPGKLDVSEFEKIRDHPSIGVSILKDIDSLDAVLPIILHHHERFSGNGYPDGISGDAIPLEARIICVADAYDAITSDRPYRKGMTHEEAINEISILKGIQFDPEVAESFLESVM